MKLHLQIIDIDEMKMKYLKFYLVFYILRHKYRIFTV